MYSSPPPVLNGLKLVNELDKPVVQQYRDNLLQQCRDYATAEMRVYLHAILLRTSWHAIFYLLFERRLRFVAYTVPNGFGLTFMFILLL